MKSLFITLIGILAATASFGQKKVVEDSIYVSGVCGMCETRIEEALDIKGIKVADWDVETKKMFIVYRKDKISEDEIHKTIAGVGHDTDKVKASDEVYASLPFCCLHRDQETHSDHDRKKDGHKQNPHH